MYPTLSRSPRLAGEYLLTSTLFPSCKGMVWNDEDSALIFYTNEHMDILRSEPRQNLSMDGTIKTTLALFQQAIIMHVLDRDNTNITHAFPVISVLITSKKENLYREVFDKLRRDIDFLIPTFMMADFEKGSSNALQQLFPTVTAVIFIIFQQ